MSTTSSADWYDTVGPSKGWRPSGMGLEDSSLSARLRRAQERIHGGIVHGTNNRYNKGCRCEPCRAAGRAYGRLRRARRAERKASAA
jgi:hypothetical protein